MGGQVKLPTLLLFFALFGGVQQFGIIGLFVGPIVLAVTITLLNLIRDELKAWQANVPEVKPPATESP
jgi:predicted PurR-regulated permease PerM